MRYIELAQPLQYGLILELASSKYPRRNIKIFGSLQYKRIRFIGQQQNHFYAWMVLKVFKYLFCIRPAS